MLLARRKSRVNQKAVGLMLGSEIAARQRVECLKSLETQVEDYALKNSELWFALYIPIF